MMKGKAYLGLLFTFIFLMSVCVEPVKAYSTITIDNTIGYTSHGESILHAFVDMNHKYAVLPNGKCVLSYIESTYLTYRIIVYNVDGTEYSNQQQTVPSALKGTDLTLKVVSDTDIFIFIGGYSTTYSYLAIIRYNPTSSSIVDTDYSSGVQLSYEGTAGYLSDALLYSTKYYILFTTNLEAGANGEGGRLFLYEYTVGATPTLKATLFSMAPVHPHDYINPPYWFQHPTDSSKAYMMYSSSDIAISSYEVSLTAYTATLLNSFSVSDDEITFTQARGSKFIGGGIEVNGTDIHLYYSFIKSYYSAGDCIIRFVQARAIFNTTISAATFLSHERYAYERYLEYTTLGYGVWTTGYEVDKTHYLIFFKDYDFSGTDDFSKVEITFTDWFDTFGYSSSYTENTADAIPSPSKNCVVGFRGHDSNWGMAYDGDTTTIYVYRSLGIVGGSYTLTATVSPSDTPLVRNTAYTWTITMKLNGIAYPNGIVNVKVDGLPLASGGTKITNSLGKVVWTFVFSSTGTHNVTMYALASMVSPTVATLDLEYLVVEGDEPTGITTSPILMSSLMNLLITFLPVALGVMVPAMAGAKAAGLSGMILGSLLGVVICTSVGLLPVYVVYLMVLVFSITFVLVIRMGGSSNSGG